MENVHKIWNLVAPGCWMASIDLRDAYYSVKIHPQSQNYFKFIFMNKLYILDRCMARIFWISKTDISRDVFPTWNLMLFHNLLVTTWLSGGCG